MTCTPFVVPGLWGETGATTGSPLHIVAPPRGCLRDCHAAAKCVFTAKCFGVPPQLDSSFVCGGDYCVFDPSASVEPVPGNRLPLIDANFPLAGFGPV